MMRLLEKNMAAGYRIALAFLIMMIFFLPGCYKMNPAYEFKSPYYQLDTLPAGSILHVPTGTLISKEQLITYISSSRIVYVGEAHDNLEDHKVQLNVIKAMYELHPGHVSVGMEMFRRSAQPVLDKWVAGQLEKRDFLKEWIKNWGLDYDYYRDILEYVRDKHIPLIALNASKKQIHKLIHNGANAATGNSHISLPEMDTSDPYHRKMVETVFRDSSHVKGDFDRFYKMQLLWEETMAETIADYLNGHEKKRRIVVLAGGGHVSYGYGLPKRVFRRLPALYTTILPLSPQVTENVKLAEKKGVRLLDNDIPQPPLYIADFVWVTEYRRIKK